MTAVGAEPVLLPSILGERQRSSAELRALAAEASRGDRSVGELLSRLAEAVEGDRRDEIRAYVAAIPARAVAEGATFIHRSIWGIAEVVRGALVLLPIAVTWYGLSAGANAYGELIKARPEHVSEPFLLLWQQGFDGTTALTFSTLAAVDGLLISLIIVLSLVIHYKADVHDPKERARTLLKESEVRGVLARALSLAGSVADGSGGERLLDLDKQLQLVSIERSVDDVKLGMAQLGSFVQATERNAEVQAALVEQLSALAERQIALSNAIEGAAEKLGTIPSANQMTLGATATLAVALTLEEQEKILREIERLMGSLQEVKKAQQAATGSVTMQTDALHYFAKALVLASERVQEASQALGDSAAPAFIARPQRPRQLVLAGGAALGVLLVALSVALATRSFDSPSARYARDLRGASQSLIEIQHVHLLLPPPRSAANDQTLRDAATSLADAAARAEQWVDRNPAPAELPGIAASLRGVTTASSRSAQALLAWLAARPADARSVDEGPPVAALADLLYAEALLRDLNVQLGLVR